MNELGLSDLHAIAAFCGRSVRDAPTESELEGTLFAADQPATVLGDLSVGIVALAECSDGPHIRLLAVDPDQRGKGQGRVLVGAAEEWARSKGHQSLITGADPPYFLWPGVPSSETELLCLFERLHYTRAETNFNMDVDLTRIPDDPGGHQLAEHGDREEVDTWMETHWSNWRAEALRALDRGNLVISREGGSGDINAFCAFEVNRQGLLGPVAVRPELMGQGKGKSALLGALHELRRRGRTSISVVWIGPVVPYAAVGGRVTEVYFVYRRDLA